MPSRVASNADKKLWPILPDPDPIDRFKVIQTNSSRTLSRVKPLKATNFWKLAFCGANLHAQAVETQALRACYSAGRDAALMFGV